MSVRNWKAGVLIRVDSRHKGQAIHLMVLPEKKLIIYNIKQEICITYRKAENGKIAILCVVKPYLKHQRSFFFPDPKILLHPFYFLFSTFI